MLLKNPSIASMVSFGERSEVSFFEPSALIAMLVMGCFARFETSDFLVSVCMGDVRDWIAWRLELLDAGDI